MRGKKMSSAKRVWPVTFARASTLRRGTPITRSSSPSALRAPAGVIRESFPFAMRAHQQVFLCMLRNLRSVILLLRDLEYRGFDGFENLQITRASAQVPGNCFADLIPRRVGILIQQSFGSHQNCRRAITALRCSEIGKGILQGVKVSVSSQTFDGQNIFSTTFERKHETGKHRLAIQKNGASATLSQLAAVFRAGMTEIFAQDFQQSLIGREIDVGLLAVQSESYLRRLLRFDGQCGQVQSPRRNFAGLLRNRQCGADCIIRRRVARFAENSLTRKQSRRVVVQNLALCRSPNRQSVELFNVSFDRRNAWPGPVRSP